MRNIEVENTNTISPIHKLVLFNIEIARKNIQKKKIIFRDKRGLNKESLLEDINTNMLKKDGDPCQHRPQNKRDCPECYSELYYHIAKETYENKCPIVEKEIVIKENAPWFCSEILHAKRNKRKKERAMNRLYNDRTRDEFKQARNELTHLINIKKKEFYKRKTEEAGNDIGKLYNILDGLTGKSKKQSLPESPSDIELANKFAEFFESKITTIFDNIEIVENYQTVVQREPQNKLYRFEKTNQQRIEKIVKKVKPTHCDNDPFPFSEVKNSERLPLILDIYTKIVNLCIENKIIPTTEKSALINPILKTNLDSQCLKSYRPVSNLPFLSKIIENVILDQLQTHLNDNNILPDNQSAYRQMYSTETALCSIVNDLIINTEKGECSLLILLDLSAAFDTVVHNTLYKDLKKIGIDGDALELLSNYLQGRTYNVKIRNSISQIKPLKRGVPQGSVLGPILFCIYHRTLIYFEKT